jgi:BirA family transcriptional regulator, biotin operon repressor / biotin---[acetyl-CoA-carboxylase] ligase
MSEPLPADLEEALDRSAASRGEFGAPVVFLSETGSTNDVALAMAERGAPEGAMAIALAQTAGRGRLGREWYSPPGAGLYVSLVCRSTRALPLLTLAGGVAVADGIRCATGLPVFIKWPNDVVVLDETVPGRRRKLAGVLAEGSSGAQGLHYVVLGFGINLRPAAYPSGLASRATSIETELGRPVDRGRVLADVLSMLNRHVTALADGSAAGLLERWRALAPTAVGARVEWTENGATRSGTTSGIDDDGALLVRTPDRVERIRSGEVTWR